MKKDWMKQRELMTTTTRQALQLVSLRMNVRSHMSQIPIGWFYLIE